MTASSYAWLMIVHRQLPRPCVSGDGDSFVTLRLRADDVMTSASMHDIVTFLKVTASEKDLPMIQLGTAADLIEHLESMNSSSPLR